MNSSLPIAAGLLHDDGTPVTAPPTRPLVGYDTVPFDETRWLAWVAKGRIADAAFAEKTRTLATLAVVIAIGVASVWYVVF